MASSLDNPGAKVISPSKLAHVVLRSKNYEKMVDFYLTFLGGRITYKDDTMCLIAYDDEHHRIGIIGIPHLADKDRGTNGLEHIAFAHESLEQLALAWLQRKNNGILPFWSVNHGPTTSVYYRDPDGNNLEIQTDNMPLQESVAYMSSPEYLVNPVGVDVDMEDLIRRLKAGENPKDIQKRPDIGPRGLDTVPGH